MLPLWFLLRYVYVASLAVLQRICTVAKFLASAPTHTSAKMTSSTYGATRHQIVCLVVPFAAPYYVPAALECSTGLTRLIGTSTKFCQAPDHFMTSR